MIRSLLLTTLMLCNIVAKSQLHSVSLSSGDSSICIGNSIRFTASFYKGTFKYIGTYAGKDYFMDTVPRSWTDSRTQAQSNGLDLWIIDSLQENNAVYSFIPYRSKVDVMFWFGLYQDSTLETPGNPGVGWKWIDGRSLDTTFRYWYFNEPDDAFQVKFPANYAALGLNAMNAFWGDMTNVIPSGFTAYAIAEADAKAIGYSWSSGQINTNSINVAPSTSTSYSAAVIYGTDTVTSPASLVTVLNPGATANFTLAAGSEFCMKWNKIILSNTSVVSASPQSISYYWELGDGNTSSVNSITHIYGAPQTYTVKLKATDGNGCFTTAQKSLTVLESPLKPIISYPTGKNVFCQGDSVILNTLDQPAALNAVFKWYRGTDSVFVGKPYAAKQTGKYNLIVINANGCRDTASADVTVNALPRKPSISYTSGYSGIICAIDSTSLTAVSPDPPFRFLWYKASSPSPTLLLQTQGNTNIIKGSSSVVSTAVTEYFQVRILDSKNCYSLYSDSISVTTRPSPTASLSTNGRSSSFCEGDSIRLWGGSSPAGNSFTWTKDFLPYPGTDTVLLIKTSGVYRMIATNSFGCSRTSNPIGVFVNKYPAVATILPDPNIAELFPDGTIGICNASNTNLKINPVSSAGYQWYKDNAIITNAKNNSVNVNQAGTYRVAVTVNNCTTNSVDQKVIVRPPPSGNLLIPSNTIICNGSQLRVDANSAVRYQWYLNNVPIAGANDSFFLAGTPGVYKTEFIDIKGCKRMSSNFVNLTLVEKPQPAFTYDLYCINTQSIFTNQSQTSKSGTVTYLWRFKDGTVDSSINSKHIFPDSGLYRVSLSVIPVACPNLVDSSVANINVLSPLKGIKYGPLNAEIGKPVGLIARAIGDLYQWKPTTGLNSPFIRIPVLTPKTEQLYTVDITNRAGCITTDSILVRIFDEQDVFVAGAFTPNRDGKNDKIYPILVGVDVFNYLKIFNRWGTLVYQSNSIDPAKGWDGTYKGNDQPADTYTWVIDAVGQNGKPIRKSGSVVLIR